MMGNLAALAPLTSATSFVSMALSLWLGCYILTRSPRSRLAWQACLTLWSLAGVFGDSLIAIHPAPDTAWWRGWPVNLPLALWYHLSVKTLSPDRARRQRPFLILVYGQAIVLDVLIAGTPWIVTDSKQSLGVYFGVLSHGPLFPLLPLCMTSCALLALRNFRIARRAVSNMAFGKQFNSLVRGAVLTALAIGYAMAVIGLRLPAPTLPMVLMLGLGVGALGYGIVRYSALVDGRILRQDFALSGLLTLLLSAVYLTIMWYIHRASGLPAAVAIVVVATVIVTHTGFEFARRLLDWPFLRRPERALRAALRGAAAEVGSGGAVEAGLRSALAVVTTSVDARWGAIAVRDGDAFVVRATFHWKHVGARLPPEGLDVLDLATRSSDETAWPLAVVAPLVAEGDSLGAILLGQPNGGSTYSEHDLDLVAEAADRLAELMCRARRQDAHAKEISEMLDTFRARERRLLEEIERISAPMSRVIDLSRVPEVEDALRRLYDYSYLGEHPLAAEALARYPAATHLDRGKALNALLVAAIEKLRPAGADPRDPPSREWHPYLILHDAYVRGDSTRDIMSSLYVSEATFHRTRRNAVRAVAKALFEMDHSAVIPT